MNGLFGKRIKEARLHKKLTQKDLAEILCVTPQAISKWENGVGLPDVAMFPTISEKLDIPLEDLLTDSKEEGGGKKVAVKPLKRKGNFKIVAYIMIGIAVAMSAALALNIYFTGQNAIKSEILTAAKISGRENNFKLEFTRNDGSKGVYIRKYFFDGRLLFYYSYGEDTLYKYGDTVYDADGNFVTDKSEVFSMFDLDFISSSDSLSRLKNGDYGYDFSVGFNTEKEFLKVVSGESVTSASAHLRTDDGLFRFAEITSGDKTCSVKFSYGFEIDLRFPEFIIFA